MNETRYLRWLILICAAFVIVAGVLFYNTVKLLPFNDELWRESERRTRGRMVKNLLANNDFTGFSRGEVMAYLGPPDYDERLYWYNLGPTNAPHKRSGRTPVGDSSQFIIVFRADIQNQIDEVLLDRRPDSLGQEEFTEEKWRAATSIERGRMVTRLLSRHRWIRHPATDLLHRLGPPDGELFRTHYDVGNAGKLISFGHALVFVFDNTAHVTRFYLQ
jgi:hypothetical protein